MSDIFISYASEDRDWVIRLADLLRQQGWTVWWDRSIPFGKSFQEVIETALNEANCVIVIWSAHSVDSSWVSAEADEARNRGILVPVLIDDISPPLVFRQLQTANMADWDGDTSYRIYKKLITDIGSLLGQPPSAEQRTDRESIAHDKERPDKREHKQASKPQPIVDHVETPQIPDNTTHPFENKESGVAPWKKLSTAAVIIVGLIGLWFSGIFTDKLPKKPDQTPAVIPDPVQKEKSTPQDESTAKIIMFTSLFDEAMQEGQLDLAARFVKKASDISLNHPESQRIKAEYYSALKHQAEQEKLAQQQKDQAEAQAKELQAEREQAAKALAEAKRRKEAQIKEDARLQLAAKQAEQALILSQKKESAEEQQLELAEQQRLQALEKQQQQAQERKRQERIKIKKAQQRQAEQDKLLALQKAQEEEQQQEAERQRQAEIVAEKQRQQELKKQAAKPAPIAVAVLGVEKKLLRYGLSLPDIKAATEQQLKNAGFNVISQAESRNSAEAMTLSLTFKYMDTSSGYLSFSASSQLAPAAGQKQILWKEGESGTARDVELRKVNAIFAKTVDKFIRAHPRKGMEFR